jgi:hypothetical protein
MKWVIFLVAALSIIGCKNRKSTTVANKQPEAAKAVIVHENYSLSKDNADFDVINASINGDILTMIVSYSGGCKEHVFNAHATKIYMKSMPPQIGLMIEHINNEDNCRSIVTDTLLFNLTPIRYPGNEKDYTVIVRLPKVAEGISYKY